MVGQGKLPSWESLMFARLQPFLPTAALLLLITYFVFHALTGERGLLSTSQRNAISPPRRWS